MKRYHSATPSDRGRRTHGRHSKIAVIEGDGIGKEVVPEGLQVVEAAGAASSASTSTGSIFDWGCDHHARFGRMMPENGLDRIAGHDAIFLGAIGWPTVPDVYRCGRC